MDERFLGIFHEGASVGRCVRVCVCLQNLQLESILEVLEGKDEGVGGEVMLVGVGVGEEMRE